MRWYVLNILIHIAMGKKLTGLKEVTHTTSDRAVRTVRIDRSESLDIAHVLSWLEVLI